jgi:hypothetical protein
MRGFPHMTTKRRRTLIFAFLLYFTAIFWCMALIFAVSCK